jgi:hypothetical protein
MTAVVRAITSGSVLGPHLAAVTLTGCEEIEFGIDVGAAGR